MSQFHFISGLPRSGSTLLSGILMQNPDFHAGMSSPVGSLINGMLEQIGAGSEFYNFFDEEKRKRICTSIFDSYYQDELSKEVIFDTNRMWAARLHQLKELFEDFKVICCVRNPARLMAVLKRSTKKIFLILVKSVEPKISQPGTYTTKV